MKAFVDSVAISHEFALHLLEVGIAEGGAAGLPVAVAVVDPSMALVAFARADGTTPHSAETSRRKAQTAASTRRPTGWMNDELAGMLTLGSGNLLTNIAGGFPVVFDDQFLGGLGIAGGTPAADAKIARRVLATVGAKVPPAQ